MTLRPKYSSRTQRLLCRISPTYAGMWTTWGGVIYYPDWVRDPEAHTDTLAHEAVHVEQQRRLTWPLFFLLYVFAPLPVGFAWFRVYFEAEAYAVNVRRGTMDVEDVVRTLWAHYAWPLPKSWIRRMVRRACLRA